MSDPFSTGSLGERLRAIEPEGRLANELDEYLYHIAHDAKRRACVREAQQFLERQARAKLIEQVPQWIRDLYGNR